MTLYHEIQGSGPDVVLLHGWGFNAAIWEPVVEGLSQDYRLHLIDLPGFGRSLWQGDGYDLDTVLEVILTEVPAKAHYIGWSLGGLLAMAIAARFADRVSSLVTIGSTPCFSRQADWPGKEMSTLAGFCQQLRDHHQETLNKFLSAQFYHMPQANSFYKQCKKILARFEQPDDMALFGSLDILHQSDLRAELTYIECPNLWLFGRLDAFVDDAIMHLLPELVGNYQCYEFSKAGHVPFLTHTEECLEQLYRFLNEVR